jgi:hypothetical protein
MRGDSGQEVYVTRDNVLRVEVWKLQQRVRLEWLRWDPVHPFGMPLVRVRRGVARFGVSDRGEQVVVSVPEGWRLNVVGPPEDADVASVAADGPLGVEVRFPGM